MRLTLARAQSSARHSLTTASVSFLKPKKKALERLRFVCIRNSVSVTRHICTVPAPPGPLRSTVRLPTGPLHVGGSTCAALSTTPAVADLSTNLCSSTVLDLAFSVQCAISWSGGGCSSGSSLHARSSISTGAGSFSTSMPGATRRAESTWKIADSWQPAGAIRAATKRGGGPCSRDIRSPPWKPSRDVKTHTALGAGSPGTIGHSSETRSQPSQAQHVVVCSSTSRSRSTSSSVQGVSFPRLLVVLLRVRPGELPLDSVPPTRLAAPFRGSLNFSAAGLDPSCASATPGMVLLSTGLRKPSASMTAAFPTR
mmetsp:Transcript_29487/g.83106  ORF Transcript_29487/g.83106 Transcript_29487/m.83106 type:complete len:312 (+) Transcript_29487:945-1880(+)